MKNCLLLILAKNTIIVSGYLIYRINMNVLEGKDFDLLRRKAKNMYGAKDLQISTRRNKKYVVTLKNGDQIHFGHPDYKDFMIHQDQDRRFRYRKRASKMVTNMVI